MAQGARKSRHGRLLLLNALVSTEPPRRIVGEMPSSAPGDSWRERPSHQQLAAEESSGPDAIWDAADSSREACSM